MWLRESPYEWLLEDEFDEDQAVFLQASLLIGHDEGRYWFLNPTQVGEDGEWAASEWTPAMGLNLEADSSFTATVLTLIDAGTYEDD